MVTLQNKTAIIFTYTLAKPRQRWNNANLYLNLSKNVGLFLKEDYISFVWSPAFPKALAQWFSALAAAHRIICRSFQTHSWVGPRHQYVCRPLLRWLPNAAKVQKPCDVSNQGPCSRPRQARWCVLKRMGARKLSGYKTRTSWALFFRGKNVHIPCLRPSPVLRTKSCVSLARISEPNFWTWRSWSRNTPLYSSRKLMVLGLPGSDSPKDRKRHISHRRTGGTWHHTWTVFLGWSQASQAPTPIPSPGCDDCTSIQVPLALGSVAPSQKLTPAQILYIIKARRPSRLLGNAVREKAEHWLDAQASDTFAQARSFSDLQRRRLPGSWALCARGEGCGFVSSRCRVSVAAVRKRPWELGGGAVVVERGDAALPASECVCGDVSAPWEVRTQSCLSPTPACAFVPWMRALFQVVFQVHLLVGPTPAFRSEVWSLPPVNKNSRRAFWKMKECLLFRNGLQAKETEPPR